MSVSTSFFKFLKGGNPHVLFLDYKMRELEVHNVTDFKADDIADLIKSRGFKEEEITQDHPGFKETEEYFEKMKAKMSKEEYDKLMKEMEELMAPKKKEFDDKLLDGEDNTVFFDPEEKKKFEEYKEKQRKERDEQRKKDAEEAESKKETEEEEVNKEEAAKKDL